MDGAARIRDQLEGIAEGHQVLVIDRSGELVVLNYAA